MKVFVSSTYKDLEQYRASVKTALDRLDGCDFVGMEYFGARNASPRDYIEKRLQLCDCYLGLIGHLYGSCPPNDERSFTEIEYELAVELDMPRLMFVAGDEVKVPPALIEPDAKREKQKKFREKVNTSCVRGNMTTPQDLAAEVAIAVSNLMHEMANAEQSRPPIGIQSEACEDTEAANDEATSPKDEALSNTLRGLLAGQTAYEKLKNSALSASERARLVILAVASADRVYPTPLPIQLSQLSYRHRESMDLSSSELSVVLATILGHNRDYSAGWYWFRDYTRNQTLDLLHRASLDDFGQQSSSTAIDLLDSSTGHGHPIAAPSLERMKLEFPHLDSETQGKWLSYWGRHATLEYAEYIDSIQFDEDDPLQHACRLATVTIRFRANPDETFRRLIAEDFDATTWGILDKYSHLVSTKELAEAVETSDNPFASQLYAAICDRTDIPVDSAKKLLESSALQVRYASAASLIESGEVLDNPEIAKALEVDKEPQSSAFFGYATPSVNQDSLYRRRYARMSYDDLTNRLYTWDDFHQHVAYRILATDHFDRFCGSIRSDLADGFVAFEAKRRESLRAEFMRMGSVTKDEKLIQLMKETPLDRLLEQFNLTNWPSSSEFIKDQLISSALAGIALHGQESDVEIARKYTLHKETGLFGSKWFRKEAVDVIAKFGNEQDMALLMDVATQQDNEVAVVAAEGAVRIAGADKETVQRLLQCNGTSVQKVAVRTILKSKSMESAKIVFDCLRNKAAVIRLYTLKLLVERLNASDTEEILKLYLNQGAYYYDVVCWLDRILYAPAPLRDVFRAQFLNDSNE